jgi:hypothetical protein
LSVVSLTEFNAAFERSDLGVFALFIPLAPEPKFDLLMWTIHMSARMLVIEREKSGQCEYGREVFESIQLKTILNRSLKSF